MEIRLVISGNEIILNRDSGIINGERKLIPEIISYYHSLFPDCKVSFGSFIGSLKFLGISGKCNYDSDSSEWIFDFPDSGDTLVFDETGVYHYDSEGETERWGHNISNGFWQDLLDYDTKLAYCYFEMESYLV